MVSPKQQDKRGRRKDMNNQTTLAVTKLNRDTSVSSMVEYICGLPPDVASTIVKQVNQHLHKSHIVEQTLSSLTTELNNGDEVRLKTGPYRGAVGKVVSVRRSRCYVEIPGRDKALYVYRNEVERV